MRVTRVPPQKRGATGQLTHDGQTGVSSIARSWISKVECSPGVIEAVWVRQADVVPGSVVLCMATLHPQDGFGDSRFSVYGESSHAAGCTGEGFGVYTNGLEG